MCCMCNAAARHAPSHAAVHRGCCVCLNSSAQAACGGCSVAVHFGDASEEREMRSLSCLRCEKLCRRFLLSSSSQTFFFPARCVSARRRLPCADHSATVLRKPPLRGSLVVKSQLMPDSAAVLSDAKGKTNLKCFARMRATAVMANASGASCLEECCSSTNIF